MDQNKGGLLINKVLFGRPFTPSVLVQGLENNIAIVWWLSLRSHLLSALCLAAPALLQILCRVSESVQVLLQYDSKFVAEVNFTSIRLCIFLGRDCFYCFLYKSPNSKTCACDLNLVSITVCHQNVKVTAVWLLIRSKELKIRLFGSTSWSQIMESLTCQAGLDSASVCEQDENC